MKNNKKIYTLLIIFTFILAPLLKGQINYKFINEKTFNQYQQKEWKSLIKTAKLSLKNDIDFYYLQVRMGIAYYELKKYSQAIKHFEKAYSINNDDELIQEYLYFSYLFIGRYDDARVLSGKFKKALKEKLHISAEHPFINAVFVQTKQDINEEYRYYPNSDEIVNQKAVTKQSIYNISIQHLIGDKISIFHGYSNIGITNIVLDDEIISNQTFEENINQNEYYFSLKAQISKGFTLNSGFHYLHSNFNAPDPTAISGRWGNNSSYPLYNFSTNSFVGAINLAKQFSIFNISIGMSVSNLNENTQVQPEVNLRIYPFNNSKFYTNSKILRIVENTDDIDNKSPILKQSFGLNFLKYSWLETSFTYGDMKNYTQYNALIANNDIDVTKQKFETLLNLGLNKGKFNIFLKYEYNIKENTFEINNTENKKEYVNQAITGGISLYFKKY